VNGTIFNDSGRARYSHSTMSQSHSFTRDDDMATSRSHPPSLDPRPRGMSATSDSSPSLPTPDFGRTNSDQFTFSSANTLSSDIPHFLSRDYLVNGHSKVGSGSSVTPDTSISSRSHGGRPNTSRSLESGAFPRPSVESYDAGRSPLATGVHDQFDGPADIPPSSRPFSGMFHSAMPPDEIDGSRRSSRASSQDARGRRRSYNVLFLAASLFEFNISAKSEAGYPYLTYQAGELFDVVAEKGEIWLAKNQDDPSERVGWIWSKHFARLATD